MNVVWHLWGLGETAIKKRSRLLSTLYVSGSVLSSDQHDPIKPIRWKVLGDTPTPHALPSVQGLPHTNMWNPWALENSGEGARRAECSGGGKPG